MDENVIHIYYELTLLVVTYKIGGNDKVVNETRS